MSLQEGTAESGAGLARSAALRSGLVTALCLVGGFLVAILAGSALFDGLPGHLPMGTKTALAALPALIGVLVGGALWGRALARTAAIPNVRRMTYAGALGYGPAVILAGFLLSVLENLIVEQGRGPHLPVHVLYTALFVPAAFLVAAVGALALGLALPGKARPARLALGSGLAAAAAFLLVNQGMHALGWEVGAPRAAERATMVTVTLAGMLAACLAAGSFIGLSLPKGERP